MIAGSKGFDPAQIQTSDALLMFFFMVLGPSLSSLIHTRALDGGAGIKRLFGRMKIWRVGIGGYLPLLTTPILAEAVLWTMALTVSPIYKPSSNLLFGLVVGGLAGFLEELGWTGFALPRLRMKYGVFTSGLILGLIWAVWHGMADFWGNFASYGSLWLPYYLIFWLLPLPAYRILMAYSNEKTKSLLIAQLMHMFYTGTLLAVSPQMPVIPGMVWQGAFAAALWLLVLGIAVRERRQHKTKKFIINSE